MNVIIDLLPLSVLVGLLASGRAGAAVACAAAILACVPAFMFGNGGQANLASTVGQAIWLALPPVAILFGGLLFHAAVSRQDATLTMEAAGADTRIRRLFTAVFFLGPFTESVTGFGVGMVFAVGALRPLGVSGASLAMLATMTQMLIPWGGLGPGTALGAALAEVPAQLVAQADSLMSPAWLFAMLAISWRVAAAVGLTIPAREKSVQAGWLAIESALLIGAHAVLPWESAGIVATGPLLALRLYRADPPRCRADWLRAGRAVAPYGVLTVALLAIRSAWFLPSAKPFANLPAIGLNHPAVALWLVAASWLMTRGERSTIIVSALRRGLRPAVAMTLYILFARMLLAAGIPGRLADAIGGALGGSAMFAAPLLGTASGFFAGTNVGANAMLMPLQASLGRLSGAMPTLLPAVQNFCATAAVVLSPALVAIACGLSGEARPIHVWRLGWPLLPTAVAIGLAALLIGGPV